MTKTKPNKEEWWEEFDKEFTQSYPGDSGIAGNDPQEPVYEWACYPNDVKKFIKTLLKTQKKEWIKQVREGMRRRPQNIEMLSVEKFKKQYPHKTGVEVSIENRRRQDSYMNYLKDLEKWAEDDLATFLKECKRILQREWKKKNKEKLKEYTKRYREKYKEIYLERTKNGERITQNIGRNMQKSGERKI